MMFFRNRRRRDDREFVALLAERDALQRDLATRTRERDWARADLSAARRHADERVRDAETARRAEHNRNALLAKQLRDAQRAYDATDKGILTSRLERALRGCARYRHELATIPQRRLVRDLELSERACRDLDRQIAELQTANEAHYAAMYDLATTDQPREHEVTP